MSPRTIDLPAYVFYDSVEGLDKLGIEFQVTYAKGDGKIFEITEWLFEDDKDHEEDYIVRTWQWIDAAPPGKPVFKLPPDGQIIKDEDFVKGEYLMLDAVDHSGNVLESMGGGLHLDPSEFQSKLAGSTPSTERYEYLVSLFDGDIEINAGKLSETIEVGRGGSATVNAGKGDDKLRVWQDKNVVFNGGKGEDTIVFSKGADLTPVALQGAVVNLTTGTGTNPFGGTLAFTQVENAVGVDTKANVLIGNAEANRLTSGWEADTIKGEGGDDTILLTARFASGPLATQVDGGFGNDHLTAVLSVSSTLDSSFRNINTLDLLDPSSNTGRFEGGTFADFEVYEAIGSSDMVFDFRGSNEGEAVIGTGYGDSLQGRGGNDTLRGAFGTDTIDGGDGRDVADYSDNLFAKVVAKINGASTTITVGGVQQDVLISIEGAKGGGSNDKLTGDGGANEFDGSLGKDTLTGKGGKDHFVFSTELSAGNIDTIKDFAHGKDKLDLDDAIFAALDPKVSSGEFLKVSSGHAAKQKDDHLIYNKTDGTLWYDDDGSGKHAALKFAVLTGSPDNLSASDFHIV